MPNNNYGQVQLRLPHNLGYPHGVVQLHLSQAGEGQAFLVAAARWGADPAQAAQVAYAQIAAVLRARGLVMVHERIFGSLAVRPTVLARRAQALQAEGLSPEGPLTYIQGHPPWGPGFAGVIIQAVARVAPGDKVWTIESGGRPLGRVWRRRGATFLVLQNLHGLAPGPARRNTPPLQARRLLKGAAQVLKAQGASFRDVIHTWFYLRDILSWYREFNLVRNAAYRQFGILSENGNGRLRPPASTGIGAALPGGSAAALDLLAIIGPEGFRPMIKQLSNPHQLDAFIYGSAFSRGVLIREADISLIQVSGTAAIDKSGASLYPGDVGSQIDWTLDKIAALIGQKGATLQDIGAACVFVKQPQDALIYLERAAARGLQDFPGVCVVADVCREELLFEVEAVAAFCHSAAPNPQGWPGVQ